MRQTATIARQTMRQPVIRSVKEKGQALRMRYLIRATLINNLLSAGRVSSLSGVRVAARYPPHRHYASAAWSEYKNPSVNRRRKPSSDAPNPRKDIGYRGRSALTRKNLPCEMLFRASRQKTRLQRIKRTIVGNTQCRRIVLPLAAHKGWSIARNSPGASCASSSTLSCCPFSSACSIMAVRSDSGVTRNWSRPRFPRPDCASHLSQPACWA